MVLIGADTRFLASTRGHIVTLLRRDRRSVEDLAQALDLTPNAVRMQLTALERDGLVQRDGVRRGAGKPATLYELTPEAERIFPKAYGTLLHLFLDVVSERLPPAALEEVVREVGRRLAALAPRGSPVSGTWGAAGAPAPGERAARAIAVLHDVGGLAELEEGDGAAVIRGYSCPLAAVAPAHPEVCRLMETLLSALLGAAVRERCERGEPQCLFVLPTAPEPQPVERAP